MGIYQYLASSGSNTTDGISYTWRNTFTSIIVSSSQTNFVMENSDGTFTEIDGSGLTYTSGTVTGGTINGAIHYSSGQVRSNIEQITGLNLSGSEFGALIAASSNAGFDYLLSGDDRILASYENGVNFYYDGEAGSNTLDLSAFGATGATIVFGATVGEESSIGANGTLSYANNFQYVSGSAGSDQFEFYANGPGSLPSGLTLNGGSGTNSIMIYNADISNVGILDLTSDTFQAIQQLEFFDGPENIVQFLATQFGSGGIAQTLSVQSDNNAQSGDFIQIFMGNATSFDASGFTFTSPAETQLQINGSSSSANLVIIGSAYALTSESLVGGSGNDVITGFADDEVFGEAGFNILIEGSPGVSLVLGGPLADSIQEFVANSGTNIISVSNADTDFVYLYGGAGNDTMSTGSGGGYLFGEDGSNTLTGGAGVNIFVGGTGSNVMNGGTGTNIYYTTTNDTINGAGTFNTDILLAANVELSLGSSDVQMVILNSGTNSVSMAGSNQFDYLYGGAGNDTLATGAGGGYLIGEGGSNTLYGGGGTNVFVGGGGGSNVMHGGSGLNVYYVGANDSVTGAGQFNTLIELNSGVTEILGSAGRTGIQEVLANAGNNVLDASALSTQIYLYGGAGNDTLIGGTGNDFLYGGAGTNTFGFHAGWGQDTIMDWTAGTNNVIDLAALSSLGVHSITDLTQTIINGSDVITSSHTGTNSIRLNGINSMLNASSFHFA